MADIFELFKKISSGNSSPAKLTHIIVGLGNPGEKYSRTRHNAGFLAMDFIAQKYGLPKFSQRFKAAVADGSIGPHRALFMKPETFMNNSGEAVREAADFYKIPPQNIVVISDDVNLAPGTVRIRESGSAGGQKGLLSVIEQIGSDLFPRIRIGVGAKPRPDYDLADWVLGEIPGSDWPAMTDAFGRAAEALPLILEGRCADAMAKYNGKARLVSTGDGADDSKNSGDNV